MPLINVRRSPSGDLTQRIVQVPATGNPNNFLNEEGNFVPIVIPPPPQQFLTFGPEYRGTLVTTTGVGVDANLIVGGGNCATMLIPTPGATLKHCFLHFSLNNNAPLQVGQSVRQWLSIGPQVGPFTQILEVTWAGAPTLEGIWLEDIDLDIPGGLTMRVQQEVLGSQLNGNGIGTCIPLLMIDV